MPITYNKNYTSFNEDIIYTKMLMMVKTLFIPHPFLAISKCNKNNIQKMNEKIKKQQLEAIYVLLPYDDILNCKIFELNNWINKKSSLVSFNTQDEEIKEFINKHNTLSGGNNNIYCDIELKTDTTIYT